MEASVSVIDSILIWKEGMPEEIFEGETGQETTFSKRLQPCETAIVEVDGLRCLNLGVRVTTPRGGQSLKIKKVVGVGNAMLVFAQIHIKEGTMGCASFSTAQDRKIVPLNDDLYTDDVLPGLAYFVAGVSADIQSRQDLSPCEYSGGTLSPINPVSKIVCIKNSSDFESICEIARSNMVSLLAILRKGCSDDYDSRTTERVTDPDPMMAERKKIWERLSSEEDRHKPALEKDRHQSAFPYLKVLGGIAIPIILLALGTVLTQNRE